MKETPEQVVKECALNLDLHREAFKQTAHSENFDIYKHQTIPGLELAVIRKQSQPHYHSEDTFFCFTEDAILTLGEVDQDGIGQVSDMVAIAYQVYPIKGGVLHAASPLRNKESVTIVIYTPTGDRARKAEYPDDTIMPITTIWGEKLI
jgi:hypothetical protein